MATGILEFRSFSVTSNLGDLCWSSNFRKIVIIADGSGYEIICCAYSIESLTIRLFAELLVSTFQQNRGQTSIRILIPESIQSSSMVTIKPHIQIFMGSKSWTENRDLDSMAATTQTRMDNTERPTMTYILK